MINKNLLPEKDRELIELAERFEAARSEQRSIYMDSEDLADLAEWYSRRNRFKHAADVIECGLKLHPDNTSLLVEKVYLHLDSSNWPKPRRLPGRLPRSGPTSPSCGPGCWQRTAVWTKPN